MYYRRRFGWLPVLILFLVVLMFFSGGFHHHMFFFAPLFLCFPFVILAGLAALFMAMRRHHGDWPKRKHYGYDDHDEDSDIFYM